MKNKILLLLLLCSSLSFAQSKRDSSWQISLGGNSSKEFYQFYTWDVYKLTNKPNYSFYANARITKYVGKRKRIGFLIDSYIGMSRIAFNAIIPNTDFTNLADSFSNKSNYNSSLSGWNFFRNGQLLPEETYTYKYDYWVSGAKIGFNYRWSKLIETSANFGFLHYKFYKKNYPDFNLAYAYGSLTGIKTTHTPIRYYEKNYSRVCVGAELILHLNKILSVNVSTSFRFYQDNYAMFLFDGGSGKPRKTGYSSISLGVNYKL